MQPIDGLKTKIAAVSTLLDDIIQTASMTNLPPEMRALTDLERAQLITVLETTLSVLRAPMAEKGILAKSSRLLGGVARRVAEKEAEQALGTAAQEAGGWLADIISMIWPGGS